LSHNEPPILYLYNIPNLIQSDSLEADDTTPVPLSSELC
jgi:hypothetical protein